MQFGLHSYLNKDSPEWKALPLRSVAPPAKALTHRAR